MRIFTYFMLKLFKIFIGSLILIFSIFVTIDALEKLDFALRYDKDLLTLLKTSFLGALVHTSYFIKASLIISFIGFFFVVKASNELLAFKALGYKISSLLGCFLAFSVLLGFVLLAKSEFLSSKFRDWARLAKKEFQDDSPYEENLFILSGNWLLLIKKWDPRTGQARGVYALAMSDNDPKVIFLARKAKWDFNLNILRFTAEGLLVKGGSNFKKVQAGKRKYSLSVPLLVSKDLVLNQEDFTIRGLFAQKQNREARGIPQWQVDFKIFKVVYENFFSLAQLAGVFFITMFLFNPSSLFVFLLCGIISLGLSLVLQLIVFSLIYSFQAGFWEAVLVAIMVILGLWLLIFYSNQIIKVLKSLGFFKSFQGSNI